MIYLLIGIHILVCAFLVIVVLLQSGKAADLAGAFGGMGSQTAFGPRGAATVLTKATTVAAVLFMLTSMTLSIYATRAGHSSAGGASVLDSQKSAPAPAPGTTPVTVPGEPGGAPVDIQVVPEGAQPKEGGGIVVTPAPNLPGEAPPQPAPAQQKK